MLYVENKKKKEKSILAKYPDAIIVDVTSKATNSMVKLSPFYPIGDIPVPFSEGITAACVEAIWQGLKVFETADVDVDLFQNTSMKNIKRTARKFGKPLGHRKGVKGDVLLDYLHARFLIYLPTYRWVLENKVKHIVDRLSTSSQTKDIVLLDYETNCDPLNQNKPLSHAGLIKAFIENKYPEIQLLNSFLDNPSLFDQPKTNPSLKKKKSTRKKSSKSKSKPSDNILELF